MKKTILLTAAVLAILFGWPVQISANNQVSASNQAPANSQSQIDYEKEFLERYKFFISDQDKEAFKKLGTDQERDEFIEKFWKDWDPDPNTPENENKIEFDRRIDNVLEDKVFLGDPEIFGFSFRANGGMGRFTPAHVYVFYGEPHWRKKLSGHSFVDLMLWIYFDERGREMYRFLFYEKGAHLILFEKQSLSHDFESMKWALWEIDRGGMMTNRDAEEVLNDLFTIAGPDVYYFLRALESFSDYSHIQPRTALGVPISPAKLIGLIKVIGLPPKLNREIIASEDPASLQVDFRYYGDGLFVGFTRYKDLDWVILDENKLTFIFKFRIFFYNQTTREKYVFDVSDAAINKLRDEYEQNKDKALTFAIGGLKEFFNKLPAGTYDIQIYVKSFATSKYNEITIKSVAKPR